MVLAIDIGNTRTKGAVFEGNELVDSFVGLSGEREKEISIWFKKYPKITDIVLSSVGKELNTDLFERHNTSKIHRITHQSKFPFQNKYSTPETLGVDRMVLASGSTIQFPNQNRLVIDIGTCITYDFTDSNDHYLGGAISPGFRLRYESLHNYTARLPLLTLENPMDIIGDSTASAIHSGVVNGVANEIDGFINSYRARYPNFIIILTGGDAEFLAARLKNSIFANPNFLLESLNQTFQYILND